MQREADYHKDAVIYNEMMADQARVIKEIVRTKKIKNWCDSAIERFEEHAARQRKNLKNLVTSADTKDEKDVVVDPTTPTPEAEPESSGTESDVETISQESTSPPVVNSEQAGGNPPLADGCSPFHDPTNPNCEFSPIPKEGNNG